MESTNQRAGGAGFEGIRLARPVEVRSEGPARRGGAEGSAGSRDGLRLTKEESAYLSGYLKDLTDRERQVVLTVCAEGTNEEAARRLDVTLATLRTHLMKVNQKLGTSSKTDVVRFAAARVLEGYRTGELRGVDSGKSGDSGLRSEWS